MVIKVAKIILNILPKSIVFSIVCMPLVFLFEEYNIFKNFYFIQIIGKVIELILAMGIGFLPVINTILYLIVIIVTFFSTNRMDTKQVKKITFLYIFYLLLICVYVYFGLKAEGKMS